MPSINKKIKQLKKKIEEQEQRIRNLEGWKIHLYNIYDLDEVLRWREYITRWDAFLDSKPENEQVIKCLNHLTPLYKDIINIIILYGNFKTSYFT